MLEDAVGQVLGGADEQSATAFAGENVGVVYGLHASQHLVTGLEVVSEGCEIPAFAGMTLEVAGMTLGVADVILKMARMPVR